MTNGMQPNQELDALADEHRTWFSAFDPQYQRNWEKLLNADYEAAMTEASVRRLLQRHGVTVQPNEDLMGANQQPDFKCSVRRCCHIRRSNFYVEVTCITIESAEGKTGIEDQPKPEFAPFNVMGMTEAIFAKCRDKAPQCANLDAPALVAVGTFHSTAAMVGFKNVLVNCVLTGKTKMAWNIDKQTGQQAGDTYQTTELAKAAFLRPDNAEEVGYARSSISGLLLCGVGLDPPRIVGVLHPNPARQFSSAILPNIEFGEVEIDKASKQIHVRWPKGMND